MGAAKRRYGAKLGPRLPIRSIFLLQEGAYALTLRKHGDRDLLIQREKKRGVYSI
jgi:hypothetical protein